MSHRFAGLWAEKRSDTKADLLTLPLEMARNRSCFLKTSMRLSV